MTKRAHELVWALALVGLGACTTTDPAAPEVPPVARVKSFAAAPAEVSAGGTVTLSWEVENAGRVSLRTGSGAAVALPDPTQARGTVELTVEQSTIFVLGASGEGGSDSALTSVAVTEEAAEPMFVAFPAQLEAGQSATLVWSAAGAQQLALREAGGQTLLAEAGASGTFSVSPAFTTRYELVVDGEVRHASVTVAPAIRAFASDPRVAEPGEVVNLSWSVGGAESVTLSAVGRGVLTTTTSAAEMLDGLFADTLPGTLPANGQVVYRLEAKAGAITREATLTVYAGADPVFVEFSAPSFFKLGTLMQLSWQTAGADRLVMELDGVPLYEATSAGEVAAGAAELPAPAQPAVLTVRATNGRGGQTVKTVELSPVGLPSLNSFNAAPGVVARGGDPITLSWDVDQARHVRITTSGGRVVHEATGKDVGVGSAVVYANVDETWSLLADNTLGDATAATTSARVTTPARFTFSADPVPALARIDVTGHDVPAGGAILGLPTLQKNAPGAAFVDISSSGVDLDYDGPDTGGRPVTLPAVFTTELFGVPYSGVQLCIGNNGWLRLGATSCSGYEGPWSLPTTALEPLAVAPLWTDLYEVSASELFYQLDRVGTEQRLIVQWNRFEHDDIPGSVITVQAQLYSSGRIVFAYQALTNFANRPFAVGVVDGDESGALVVPDTPAAGDTFTLFGVTSAPYPVVASGKPLKSRVMIGTSGGFLEVESGVTIIPPGRFGISEVNHNPAPGASEWIELRNDSAQPIDLAGWSLDFGSGGTHLLSAANGNTVLPPNGFLLLGQDADAAEASAGGPQVDYVYGPSFSMPDASGSIRLGMGGAAYSQHAWAAAGTAGTATQVDVAEHLRLGTGATSSSCPASATYGSGTQLGTPRAAHPACFKYRVASLPTGDFQSILSTGANAGTLTSTSDDSISQITLPRPVKLAGQPYSTLWVSANGFISTASVGSFPGNKTTPSSAAPVGVIAPFWDDLQGNGGTTSKVAWEQFDPDGTAASGDEYTLISWENWKRYGTTSSLNFQVKFFEASGDFEFHFGDMTGGDRATGSEATTWFENGTGTAALVINADTAGGIQPHSGYRFTAVP